jgi:NAD(P)H-hydrate epimerase
MAAQGGARGPLFSALEVRVLELNAAARGLSIDTMMENAGAAVADEARRHLPAPPSPVGIVCGSGNNGGDGLAAAFHLQQMGYSPRVWLLAPPSQIHSEPARAMWRRVSSTADLRGGVPKVAELRDLPLLLDAMIGTGGGGELKDPYRAAVLEINASGVPVLSVDLPTGLGSTTVLQARWTVSLEVLKEGMEHPAVGEVTVRSIGIPPEARDETGPGEFLLFPVPGRSTRKGGQGRLVVVGGGPYAGAPALAALSALRAGVDMAFVITPGGVADLVQGFSPEIIVRGVGHGRIFHEEEAHALWSLVQSLRPDALLVGNGVGTDPSTLVALEELVEEALAQVPVVLDADALRLVNHRQGVPFRDQSPRRFLLTPNAREYAHLRDPRSPSNVPVDAEEVRETARRLRLSLLVKGETDWISDGVDLKGNRTHHPAQVVGGAGDTLAGVVASLLARGRTPTQAARLGTYWVGSTALRIFPQKSYGMLASDLTTELPLTLSEGLARVQSGF